MACCCCCSYCFAAPAGSDLAGSRCRCAAVAGGTAAAAAAADNSAGSRGRCTAVAGACAGAGSTLADTFILWFIPRFGFEFCSTVLSKTQYFGLVRFST